MNDNELDELLNVWKAPPPRQSLREGVRVGIEAGHRPLRQILLRRWKFLGAAAAVVVVAFLLRDTNASPQQLRPPPYTVDSEIVLYDSWNVRRGARNVLMTSYNDFGSEVVLSWSLPDHALEAVIYAVKLAASRVVEGFQREFLLDTDPEEGAFGGVYPTMPGERMVVGRRSTLVSSGCRSISGLLNVAGEEVILNYRTVVVQENWAGGDWIITLWMAPELSCFALRATIQAKQPDGSWKLFSEKNAIKVTVNR